MSRVYIVSVFDKWERCPDGPIEESDQIQDFTEAMKVVAELMAKYLDPKIVENEDSLPQHSVELSCFELDENGIIFM